MFRGIPDSRENPSGECRLKAEAYVTYVCSGRLLADDNDVKLPPGKSAYLAEHFKNDLCF